MTNSAARRRVASLLAMFALLSALVPSTASGAQANISIVVAAYPDNLDGTNPDAFVTVSKEDSDPDPEQDNSELHYIAFDLTVTNGGTSTVTGIKLEAGPDGAPSSGRYIQTYVDPAVATCSDAPPFSCQLANLAAGAAAHLRVVVEAPFTPGEMLFDVRGTASGSTGADTPGASRGDEFTGGTTVQVVPEFRNDLANRGFGTFIPQNLVGEDLSFDTEPGLSDSNNLYTSVYIPAFAQGEIPQGTAIWFTERDQDTTCPDGSPCVGQELEIHFFDHQLAPRPIRVEVRYDELKALVKALNKWDLWHFPDPPTDPAAPSEPPFLIFGTQCVFGTAGYPVAPDGGQLQTPCGESKSWAQDDRDDGVAVFWLPKNGYIKGG